MKSQKIKILVFLTFLCMLVSGALFMYFRYIHNRPKIKIVAPRTKIDPIKFDSLLKVKHKK